jgi:hypothetical protein
MDEGTTGRRVQKKMSGKGMPGAVMPVCGCSNETIIGVIPDPIDNGG